MILFPKYHRVFLLHFMSHILWKCTFCLVSPGIGPRGQILMNILPSHLSDQHLSAYNNGLKTKGNFKYQVDHFRETDFQHLKSPQNSNFHNPIYHAV